MPMGLPKHRGPKSGAPRDRVVSVRFTSDELKQITEAGRRAGVFSASDWIREIALRPDPEPEGAV
jgi:hypothetical protein